MYSAAFHSTPVPTWEHHHGHRPKMNPSRGILWTSEQQMGTEWGMTMEKGQTGICTAPKRRTVRNGRTLFVLILGLLHELKRNEREWITYQIGLHKWDSSRTQEDTTRSYGRSARNGDTLLLCGKREKGGNWPLITSFVNLLAKIYCRFLIRNKFHLKFYDETTVSRALVLSGRHACTTRIEAEEL